jgi:ATP-dependent DNA ligase
MKLETLYKRDKTGKKILSYEVEIGLVQGGGLFANDTAIITKTTGFLDGKKQKHIDTILAGKQNRTVHQQAINEAESSWRSKRDEGYKSLEDLGIFSNTVGGYSYGTDVLIEANGSLDKCLLQALPEDRTDASGGLKPMKCTAMQDAKSGVLIPNVLKKIQYPAHVQTKLDGVRCFATNHKDGGFRFTSSSGTSYDIVCRFIKEELDNVGLPIGTILDGELYIHGTPLQKISGWCRKQSPIDVHEDIEFHIFDLPNKDVWDDRRTQLEAIITSFDHDNKHLRYVPVYRVDSIDEIQDLHDEFVEAGYEGVIVRNLDGRYSYGIRSTSIFKLKAFQDDEFVITGANEGKRGAADMVFELRTMKGQFFEAKPLGTFEKKEEYMENLDELVGKMATVRFLNYSETGVPVGNPVLKAIRDYE